MNWLSSYTNMACRHPVMNAQSATRSGLAVACVLGDSFARLGPRWLVGVSGCTRQHTQSLDSSRRVRPSIRTKDTFLERSVKKRLSFVWVDEPGQCARTLVLVRQDHGRNDRRCCGPASPGEGNKEETVQPSAGLTGGQWGPVTRSPAVCVPYASGSSITQVILRFTW